MTVNYIKYKYLNLWAKFNIFTPWSLSRKGKNSDLPSNHEPIDRQFSKSSACVWKIEHEA
jgi:hypothetical protein